MTNIPNPPAEMRTITFDSITLSEHINGCYTLNITGPGVIPKQPNKVEVPGRDYPWDFGNHEKQEFTVTAEILIVTDNTTEDLSMTEKLESLWGVLDTPEAELLDIDGEPNYYGQVFDQPTVDRNTNSTRVNISWLCREPTDQDI